MTAGSTSSPVFDFSSLDFLSVQADLQAYAQGRFPELWTDFNASNFGSHLIELMAYATDLLAYNGNAQTMEAIIATMVREQNFRTASKSFDYQLHSATPSTSSERCMLDPGGVYPFTISKHLQFATSTGIVFQPDGDTVVPSFPGVGYVDVPITQGDEKYQQNIGTTNGRAAQQFTLGSTPLIDGTLTVLIGAQPYTLVTNAISAGPTEKIFTLQTDENDVTTLTFGDGINGIIPPSGQPVLATYKIGGGSDTNLPTTVINQTIGTSDGSAVPSQILSVSNIARAENGGPKQSLASGKKNLPLSLKANDRAVSLQDYSTLAVQLVAGVLKANSVAGVFTAGGRPILMFVVPQGGGNPTPTLANQIATALVPKKMGGKRIIPLPAHYVSLAIDVDAFVQPTAAKVATAQLVTNILTSRFKLEDSEFGGVDSTLELQPTYRSIDPTENTIDGLRRATLRKFTIKPHFDRYVSVPTIGNWDFADAVLNVTSDVQRREWAITVTAVGQFSVRQRQLGTVTAITDSILSDDAAHYTPNQLSLEGWNLHVRPEEQDVVQAIVSNSDTSVSVAGGLLILAAVDDPYAVEKLESNTGKIARQNPNAPASSGQPTVSVGDSSSFSPGDKVLVREGINSALMIVDSSGVGSVTFTEDLSFPLTIAGTLDWYWESDDGTVGFVLQNGGAPFQSGDRFYVDTYPVVGDIKLRPENFPLLASTDLVVNPIGGT